MAKIGLPKGVWKTVESQGKFSEKSGNFEMDIEWQPCTNLRSGSDMTNIRPVRPKLFAKIINRSHHQTKR